MTVNRLSVGDQQTNKGEGDEHGHGEGRDRTSWAAKDQGIHA
jgi:hypothetical protein